VTLPAPGADGPLLVTATATDAAANTGNTSTNLTVDTVAPSVAITTIEGGDATINAAEAAGGIDIAGTTEIGASVDVNGVAAVVDGSGNWTVTLPAPASDGALLVTATATDAAGNTASDSTTLTVDTVAPAVAITTIEGGDDTINAAEAANGIDISGTTEVGASVDVNGVAAVVDGSGNWTVTLPTPGADGPLLVTATATDAAGNTASDSRNLTVDTGAIAIAITTIEGGDATINAAEAAGGIDIAGTTEIGASVDVNGVAAVVDGSGGWTVTLPLPGSQGPLLVTATAMDGVGNTGSTSTNLTVDTTADSPADLAVVIDDVDGFISNAEKGAVLYTVSGLDADASATVTFSSSGGGADVVVGGLGNGQTAVDLSSLGDGTITATISATDTAGNTAAGTGDNSTKDTAAPAAPIITDVTDDVAPLTGTVADNGFSDDPTLTVSGTAADGSTVTIYDTDGTTALGSAVATGGVFTITTSALSRDTTPHTLTAKATDAVGNESGASTAFHVTIDDVAFAMTEGQLGVQQGTFDLSNLGAGPYTTDGDPVNADYYVALDDFSVMKNGSQIFHDGFDDGNPPPSGQYYINGNAGLYFTDGTFFEDADNGRLIMVGREASDPLDAVPSGQFVRHSAPLNTNRQPLSDSSLGLKINADFEVAARFDLSTPDSNENYGIRLNDGIGDPTLGLHDNDIVELEVRSDGAGIPEVDLIHLDRLANTLNIIESIPFDPTGADQIVLRLNHDASDPRVISASFDLYNSGGFLSTTAFTSTDTIFNGEEWTRAEIVANAVVENDSVYVSDYGVLYVDPQGNWQYDLRNGAPALEQLGQGDSIVDHFTVQVSDGTDTTTRNIDVTVNGVNDAPKITGDLGIAVNKGGSVLLTTADFQAVDPDNTAGELTFTVSDPTHGHVEVNGVTETTFTQQQLIDEVVTFVHDNSDTTLATFKVTASDGIATSATTTIVAAVPTATIKVVTANGFDFSDETWLTAMADSESVLQGPATSTQVTIVNAVQNFRYVLEGVSLTFDSNLNPTDITGGTITAIHVLTNDTMEALIDLTANVGAAEWYNAVKDKALGSDTLFDALTGAWPLNFVGSAGTDIWSASDANDAFQNNGGINFGDTFDGEIGYDRANYTHAPGRIDVLLAPGTVDKYTDASASTIGSADMLQSIEFVTGTAYADNFDATGFSASSPNAGSVSPTNLDGTFNEFEGRGGNDVITGNGDTRISYLHATAGVTVDIAIGTADGDASVGHDTFTGVRYVRGSYFNDFLYGSDNPSNAENFEGRGGNDFIDGRGGFDRAVYGNEDEGIAVHLAAGKVVGGPNTGTDTLISVEAVAGTEFADTFTADIDPSIDPDTGLAYSAVAFGDASAANVGSNGTLNEFEGRGGDDTVTGNGNTRVAFYNALAGVTVTLTSGGAGTAVGTDPGDLAGIGNDTFTGGVNRVRGSEFNDTITGNGGRNILDGRGGDDMLTGNGGNDTFIYSTGNDTVADFNQAQGDTIDLTGSGVTSLAALLALTTQVGADTVINFSNGDSITLNNVTATNLTSADFVFDPVNITVVTASGYDMHGLYGDIAAASLNVVAGADPSISFDATNSGTGHTFHVTGTGFDAYGANGPTQGTITEIDIRDSSSATLVTIGGFFIDAGDLATAAGAFPGSGGPLTALFNQYSYSAIGGDGNDVLPSFINADTFDGGGGSNTVDYVHFSSGITVNLADPSQNTFNAEGDTYTNITNVIGTSSADTLTGDGNINVLEGGGGGDTLDGGGGSFDYASYIHASAGVTANLATPALNTGDAAGDSYVGIDGLIGSNSADTLTGNENDNYLRGRDGGDALNGGDGSDTADYNFGPAVDVDLGTPANNTGQAAGDTYVSIENLRGSPSGDALKGDAGNNVLTGLGGADTFIYSDGADTVTDFSQAQGDTVDLLDSGVTSFAAVQALLSQVGPDTLIDFTGGNTITLAGITYTDLHETDFIFHP
jgi:VCBS repeat-containing protein